MKKLIALIFSLAVIVSCFTACEKKEEYTVAIGVAENVDYENATIMQAVAAVVTDKAGKIVLARLDAVEYVIETDDGEPIIYVPLSIRDSDNRDFKSAADFLEGYAEGKTKDEIEALNSEALGENANGYTPGLIRAISKALNNQYPTKFESTFNITAGVSLFAYASADDETGTVTLGVSYAAIAADNDRIGGAVIDENEITVTLGEEDGKIISHAYKGTKLEQGEDYHMDDYNPYAVGEWYEQAAEYVKTLYYKPIDTFDEIPESKTAGCTIDTANYHAALIKASRRVR